jgi:hypothetical protein
MWNIIKNNTGNTKDAKEMACDFHTFFLSTA